MNLNNRWNDHDLAPPDKLVRTIRSGYKVSFYPCLVSWGAALFFGIEKEWLYSAGFVASGLIYLPAAVHQHRFTKNLCEPIIRDYQQRDEQHRDGNEDRRS